MGMIRVSDHAEKIIKEQANGRTISATVDALIAGVIAGGGGSSSVISKLDYLEGYLDKRLSKIESLIEDTMVDRIDGGPRKQPDFPVSLAWPDVQELFYERMKEGDPEWFPGAYKGVTEEMHGDPSCFSKDGVLYINLSGSDIPVLKITPRVDAMLAEIIEGNVNVA